MADQWASTEDHSPAHAAPQQGSDWASTEDHSPQASTTAHEVGQGFLDSTVRGVLATAKSILPKFRTPAETQEITKRTHDLIDQGKYTEAAKGMFGDAVESLPGGRLLTGLVHSSLDQIQKAKDASERGDRAAAALHYAAAVPVVGSMAAPGIDAALGQEAKYDKYGDVLEEAVPPNPARATGNVLGQATLAAAPSLVRAVTPESIPVAPARVLTTITPERAAAVSLADSESIPLTMAQRTGNRFLRSVESSAANTPGTTGMAEDVRLATRQGLQKTASRMADTVSPAVATPESAGAAVSSELSKVADTHAQEARQAYSKLSDIENDPKNLKSVQIGEKVNPDLDKLAQQLGGKPFADMDVTDQQKVIAAAPKFKIDPTSTPIMKDIALPVDMRPVKTDLRAAYDELKSQMPIAQQQSSRGLKAIENIMNGDDHLPASVADANLSAVKAIQREAVNAKSKFLANKAIAAFSPAIDQAISGAGVDASDALAYGRDMTKAKYATQETLESLPTEPVQLFNKLTAKGDVGINLLRDVAQKAPGSMKAVGRAYLEGLLDSASGVPGATAGPDAAFAAWNKLGDSTKNILFPDPVYRSRIDAFMSLAKDVATNPNPSGTAYVQAGQLFLKHPITGALYAIRNNALSRILLNPKTSKALVNGMKVPVKNTAASAVVADQLLKLAGAGAVAQDAGMDHNYAVGQEVNLKGVGKVIIKKMNPDGTFEY